MNKRRRYSDDDETLPPGWPEGVPLPTREEAEEAVRRIDESIRQAQEECRKRQRPINHHQCDCPYCTVVGVG
jgi:hypothetical protein